MSPATVLTVMHNGRKLAYGVEELKPTSVNVMWQSVAKEYQSLIEDEERDSQLLREMGLVPNIVKMIGDCRKSALLDAGTGTNWLFDRVGPADAYACDIVEPEKIRAGVNFSIQNVHSLDYENGMFDIIVASLLLIYCEDILSVFKEFRRVVRHPGGRLIMGLMQPFFYRTGQVNEDDEFVVDRDLSKPFKVDLKIAGDVGPVTYYYRPLHDYLLTLMNSGWRLTYYKDWFIDMAEYNRLGGDKIKTKIRRSGRVPLYTFIECAAN